MSRFSSHFFDPRFGLVASSHAFDRSGTDRRHWIIRPEDFVVLGFDLKNLEVVPGEGDEPATLAKDGTGFAYLTVWFPPQHILEKAYFTTVEKYPVAVSSSKDVKPPAKDPDAASGDEDPEDPPIKALVAGWSKLVFYVPDDQLPITWTLEGVLEAMRNLAMNVPANALPPEQPRPFILWESLSSSLNKLALAGDESATQITKAKAKAATSPITEAAAEARTPATASRLIGISRERRKIRTVGNALGVSTLTGSATRDLRVALEAGFGKFVARPLPKAPGTDQTALELPYRVILSPNQYGAWFHRSAPMTSAETGHTELWHTRLGVRWSDGTLIDGDDPLRKLRAVWSLDIPSPSTPKWDESVDIPDHVDYSKDPDSLYEWRASLDAYDRHNVVHLSSNYGLADGVDPDDYYEPEPLDVDLLMLSSLGAWLDSRGGWEHQPRGLSVEEWRHRATLGRDHYVRVVYAGFLFPFGHRASLVKITERQFHADKRGNTAYLRQRMFLVVREPVKTYRACGHRYDGTDPNRTGEQYDLMMPFEAVRILTRVSPLLDPPEAHDIGGKTLDCFWPYVSGEPFKFRIAATDTDGNQVDFSMPLIFVGKKEVDFDYATSIIPDDVVAAFSTQSWPDGSLFATAPLQGQKVAFAESKGPDDTAFPVQTLTFSAEVPAQAKFDKLGWRVVRFFPVVRSAAIDVPSMQRIARTSKAASVAYESTYLKNGFAGGEVFLKAVPGTELQVLFSGQSDRSGGLVAPDLKLSALSRITGVISGDDIGAAIGGSFNPAAWFGALAGAKLFGVLKLTDILKTVGFDELDKLPQFVGQSLNQVEQVISSLERLQSAIGTASLGASTIPTLLGNILASSLPSLLKGDGPATLVADLGSFQTALDALPTDLASSTLGAGPKALIAQIGAALETGIGTLLSDTSGILQKFADGDILTKALNARFEWRPLIQAVGPFKPNGDRNLLLCVEAVDAQGTTPEAFTVTCSLDDFRLDLGPLNLVFERVTIRAVAGEKMDVDVKFTDIEFGDPLSFVETLKDVIPFDGFSDPPAVQVTADGISAGFSVGLPNISIGVFSLENLAIAAGFEVPFIGKAVTTWFRFCERENPARLTVSLFGGGFFFCVTMDPDGLQILEGAIEFGAACSVNFGVASGSVSAMAGLYFKIESSNTTLAGYFRLRGEVEALGIVTVSIELYLEMRFESASGKVVGTATISLEIDVTLFSVTISISCTKKFAGSGPDPTLRELFDVTPAATSADWNEYCAAFA